MNQEDLLVLEAQDVTASVICIGVVILCTIASIFFMPSPRLNVMSHFVQREEPIVPEVAMVATRNPFTLNILNGNVASLKDGIKLKIKTSVRSQLQALWVVECSSVQQALQCDNVTLFQDASSLQGHCLHQGQPINIAAETETALHLTLPDTVTDTQIQASMGPPPRTKYPLCLILESLEEESRVNSHPRIVGGLYIIHLADDTFSDSCRLMSHLIISDTGQIWDLQKLFMAAEGTQSPQSNPGSISSPFEGTSSAAVTTNSNLERSQSDGHSNDADMNDPAMDTCVVCQNGLVSIALLPCRHTCVCTACFPLLNKCPMCRGYIESFFLLECATDEEWFRPHYDETDDDEDFPARFNNACERFNRWLGFHDL